MAFPVNVATNNAFMSEIDDDRQSVASVATSIWGGVDEPNINELRESRKAASVLRRRLAAEHANVKNMDEDDFIDAFPECDELRFQFGQAIVRHVNLARQKAALVSPKKAIHTKSHNSFKSLFKGDVSILSIVTSI